MPRPSRFSEPDLPLHVIQRGNNGGACFTTPADCRTYLSYLREASARYECAVHAYVLMTTHTHLLVTPGRPDALPLLMKRVAQKYTQYVNWRYHRIGSPWSGRYKAALVQTERYLLVCQRYIELNPVRAGVVGRPDQYPWSSYRCNGNGTPDTLVVPHAQYLALGRDSVERQYSYQQLFEHALDATHVEQIRAATNGGCAVGDQQFLERLKRQRAG